MSDGTRYQRISVDPELLEISPREVARLAKAGPVQGCAEAIDAAVAEACGLMEPRAVWTRLSADEAQTLFVEPTPVAGIVEQGPCWAFLTTIGDALEKRVQEHFAATRFLEGLLLDASGSAAADAMAERIERLCTGDESSERFSPGYCSWVMGGQRPLFALLCPDELGVELLPSFLMQPLKSVSGLIVQAPDDKLRVDPSDCADCAARGCERRQAGYGNRPALGEAEKLVDEEASRASRRMS